MTLRIRKPLEREIVLATLQMLQAKYSRWCWIRVEPASAVRARANRGKPGTAWKVKEDAWGDGVADIIGISRRCHCYTYPPCHGLHGIAFEVKRPGNKQLPSQVEFQERWTKVGGLYAVVHSPEDAIASIKRWGIERG